MSVNVNILCDGCGNNIACGFGVQRRHAHQVRSELKREGWLIEESPPRDYCPACGAKKDTSKPEIVRKMAMSAKHERDALYEVVRELFNVCDQLMGDSDLPDDDTREMRAMQKAARIIGHRGSTFVTGIDPHEQ